MNAGRSRRPSVVILSHSVTADDPRVRRQGDAFLDRGWRVLVIGLGGARAASPSWPLVEVDTEWCDAEGLFHRWKRQARAAAGLGALYAAADPRMLLDLLFPGLPAMREVARAHCPDLWLANDWPALSVAVDIARRDGAFLVYDTHELAAEEFGHSRRWRTTRLPLVRHVEGSGICFAHLVTCVSEGIAGRLTEIYNLDRRPLVVRNVPPFADAGKAAASARIRLLYHGIIAPGRGLEQAIAASPLWRPEFHLSIRGPAPDGYAAHLETLIAAQGARDRVALLPPVPVTELVQEASAFDVGFFVLPDTSQQNHHVLPNKFFEYVMAGLALCVSDLPEMAKLLNEHDLGVLARGLAPDDIARAVNALDRPRIAAYKANARSAARKLCWEQEGRRLIDACEALLLRRSSRV